MSAPLDENELARLAADARGDAVLVGLEAPDPALLAQPQLKGLFALHLGAVYHRRAVMADVMRFYAGKAGLDGAAYPALALVDRADRGRSSHAMARALYETAVAFEPDLAEAHYGLARLDQAEREHAAAVAGFERALARAPHQRASPHAFLHANAHWERAVSLETLGRDQEALAAYRAALALMTGFGVHHLRAARLLRKLGHLEEAIREYRKGMGYSHRYFPEFLLPPLGEPAPSAARPLHEIYRTGTGEVVVFWQGRYYAVPEAVWQTADASAADLTAEQAAAARSGLSIASLEI